MSTVIQVDRLSKEYRLGTIGGRRLVDDVNRWWARFRGKEDPLSKIGDRRAKMADSRQKTQSPNSNLPSSKSSPSANSHPSSSDKIWALKDVSFEVKQGEVLGIIGRNGAGKSTLLKILSRVTVPTSGEVRVKGRIASLLEVGTGFHPELTGRENIFLNGAILGMTKAEIRGKFDEIVAFSGIEQFIDTPVKRYSSGMYVRLAFAVAAHLDPEILIIDEVLAVGDAEFQKKCLGKMGDVAREGRTVIFVSHNLGSIQALCSHAIYLRGGSLISHGGVQAQITQYNKDSSEASPGKKHLTSVLSLEELEFQPVPITSGDPLDFRLVIGSLRPVSTEDLCLLIYSGIGVRVAIIDLRRAQGSYRIEPGRPLVIGGKVKSLSLVDGDYVVGLYLNTAEFKGNVYDLRTLTVAVSNRPREVKPYGSHDRGFLELDFEFYRP